MSGYYHEGEGDIVGHKVISGAKGDKEEEEVIMHPNKCGNN